MKEMSLKNGYDINTIDNTINKFLWKKFSPNKDITPSVPKDKFYFKIPFYGENYFKIRKNLTNIINNHFPVLFLRINFRFGSCLGLRTELIIPLCLC